RDDLVTGVQTCALPIWPSLPERLPGLGLLLAVARPARKPSPARHGERHGERLGRWRPWSGGRQEDVRRVLARLLERGRIEDRGRSEERRVGKAWRRGGS